MSDQIRPCIDRPLPEEARVRAIQRAMTSRPDDPGLASAGPRAARHERYRMAVLKATAWKPGRELTVGFLDGDPRVHARVLEVASEWSDHANIRFLPSDPAHADVRVSLSGDGYWSAIGMELTEYRRDEPTMSLEGFTPATPDEEVRRVVLHEFGHTLGCVHEHSSPASGIPWNREAVYAYYEGPPNHWSREDVDANLFERYEASETQFSAFDPDSIMLYPIPPEHTDGRFSVGWNRDLSPTDRSFITLLYPRGPAQVADIDVDDPPVPATLASPGSEVHFRFRIEQAGVYVVETQGFTDTVLALFGPDTLATTVAQDDDSGLGQNARIESYLDPGVYVARVGHKLAEGVGPFRLVARST